MKTIGVELSCYECDEEIRYEDEYEAPHGGYNCRCPKCKAPMFRLPFVVCHCGTTVYLQNGDTECDECGQAYNAFGDKITHMGFTEDDF